MAARERRIGASRMSIRVYEIDPSTGAETTVKEECEYGLWMPVAPPPSMNSLTYPPCHCVACRPRECPKC